MNIIIVSFKKGPTLLDPQEGTQLPIHSLFILLFEVDIFSKNFIDLNKFL
jgi:hypothetical protein